MSQPSNPTRLKEEEKALLNAACCGDLTLVNRLLSKFGVDVDIGFTRLNIAAATQTPLMRASVNGHTRIVERLLSSFANVNEVDPADGSTSLILAAKNGHANVVVILLNAGAAVQKTDKAGRTALLYGIQNGVGTIMEAQLREAGAVLTLKDRGLMLVWAAQHKGRLVSAAKAGKPEVVRWLLSCGVDTNAHDEAMFTALNWASFHGFSSIVTLLVDADADVKKPNAEGLTPLMGAIMNHHATVEVQLRTAGAELQVEDSRLLAKLMAGRMGPAACKGRLDEVNQLIALGCAVDYVDEKGGSPRTALIEAAAQGHNAVVVALLDAEADVDAASDGTAEGFDRTALVEASCNGHRGVVTALIAARAQVNTVNNESLALYCAIAAGNTAVAEELRAAGATVIKESMALYGAIVGSYADIEEDLRTAGALISKENAGKATRAALKRVHKRLFAAANNGHAEEVNELAGAGVDVNAEGEDGSTPLMHAAHGGHIGVVTALIEAGAEINRGNMEGDTPLYYAVKGGHEEVEEKLRALGGYFSEDDMPLELLGENLLDAAGRGNGKDVSRLLRVPKLHVDYAAEEDKWTALMEASSKGFPSVVEILIDASADVAKQNVDGCTPLYFAMERNHQAVLMQLYQLGAVFSREDEDRMQTDFMLAAEDGDSEKLEQLLDAGVDPDTELFGSTALITAFRGNQKTIVSRLIAAGAKVNKAEMRIELAAGMLSLCSEELEMLKSRVTQVRQRTAACAVEGAIRAASLHCSPPALASLASGTPTSIGVVGASSPDAPEGEAPAPAARAIANVDSSGRRKAMLAESNTAVERQTLEKAQTELQAKNGTLRQQSAEHSVRLSNVEEASATEAICALAAAQRGTVGAVTPASSPPRRKPQSPALRAALLAAVDYVDEKAADL